MAFGSSGRDAKKAQADFFSNMQTLFLGTESGEGGPADKSIVGQLKAAADDLRAASDMLRQSSAAQPSYGGPNGGRPSFNGDGTHRPSPHDDYLQGYAGYGALRRGVASEAAARYGSTGGIFQRGNTFRPHYDPSGQISYYDEIDQRGNKVGEHARNSPEAQQIYARQQQAQGVRQLANTPSPFSTTGRGGAVSTPGVSTAQHVVNETVGRIPVVGGIIAGVVGGLIGAPDAIMNGIVNQRAKNAQYQSILGGTNWGTGVHNRWLEEGFKLSQLYSGGLTGSMSTEAFRGVTSLGYTGNARDQSLGLITSNYKNLGMSVGDSLKFVNLMAQSSSTSFESLKTTLNQVGDAARNTGQNLQVARSGLADLMAVATASLGGNGVVGTSGLLQSYKSQLGRDFANVDMSQMLPGANIGITALQASSLGMSLNDYELQQAAGNTGQFGHAAEGLINRALAPSQAAIRPRLNQLVQQAGGIKAISATNDSWTAFVKRVSADPEIRRSGVNINALMASLKAYTGGTYNPYQAMKLLIGNTLGINTISGVQKQQHDSMLQSHHAEYSSSTDIHGHAGWHQVALSTSGLTKLKPGQKEIWDPVTGQMVVAARDAGHTVTTDPILDKFKKFANQGTHVIVQTKDGPKVVSGQYAMDHLKDQIAKGTAKFIGGNYDGQTVKEALGGGYAESNYAGTDTTHLSGTSAKHFKSVAAYEKANANKTNGNGGKVVIAPSPALAQLLNITATGNTVVANEGAQYGYAPKPGQVGLNLGGS